MNTNDKMDDNSEEKLLKRASRRAGFKIHTGIFILVNLFFWIIWIFVFRGKDGAHAETLQALLFLSIAWLIALVAHYFIVYKWNKTMVEKELDALKKQISKKEKELEKIKEMQQNETIDNKQ